MSHGFDRIAETWFRRDMQHAHRLWSVRQPVFHIQVNESVPVCRVAELAKGFPAPGAYDFLFPEYLVFSSAFQEFLGWPVADGATYERIGPD